MPVKAPAWSREEIYYITERGYRLYCEGQLHEAAILFQGLIAIDPDNAYCRKALSAIDISLGRPELAVRHLSVVIARNRFDVEALAARCETLLAMKDLAAARRDLDSLSALPAGLENARRLRLQFLREAESASAAQLPQLPGSRLDNSYGW